MQINILFPCTNGTCFSTAVAYFQSANVPHQPTCSNVFGNAMFGTPTYNTQSCLNVSTYTVVAVHNMTTKGCSNAFVVSQGKWNFVLA
jgi:hypothetical protein